MTKTLIFEGAGWENAPHNDVGNCRIRTKFLNLNNEFIYLELTGHEQSEFKGFVSHCFNMKDERTNHTKELAHVERIPFKYSKKGILELVNKNLNCNFTDIKIVNEGLNVFNTDKPLCSCYEEQK